MSDRESRRLPGNRVVRKRRNPTQIIDIPPSRPTDDIPNVRTSAKRFVLALTVLVAVGAVLLMLPWTTEADKSTSVVDAIFTAVSASSVTGLVVLDTQDHWNLFGEIIILLLIQVGGLGFMVGASVVLASLGRSMSLRDSLLLQDGAPTLSLAEATQLSKRILVFMLAFESVGAVLFTLEFLPGRSPGVAIWHGVFTSISAFCNSGIDLEGEFRSTSGFANSWLFSLTGFLLIQAGALSYVTFGDIWKKRRWQRFSLDTKLVLMTNGILLLGGMVAFLLLEWTNTLSQVDAVYRPMVAFFQSASTRTAGFSSVQFGDAHPATIFLSIALMLVGGAAGSTTGGVKLATVAILFLAVISTVRGQADPQAFGRRVSIQQVFRAMALTALFLFAHFVLTLLLAITEEVIAGHQFGFLPIMLESMSAIATAGLSTGITSEISEPGKILLCLGMYLGRLGPLMAVYALQRRQQLPLYRYPESSVRIG